MVSSVLSFGLNGLDAFPVTVEVDVANGLPAFEIVGLPDTAVKESKERVRSSVKNSGFSFPAKRITVNLAPADIRKAAPVYDLAIVTGFLKCCDQIRNDLSHIAMIGELSLSGEIRPVRGVLPMVLKAREMSVRGIMIPRGNVHEVQFVDGIAIFPVSSVAEVVGILRRSIEAAPMTPVAFQPDQPQDYQVDFCDVKGQYTARRAIEIAAAGGHNLLMVGPPGSGKSMLAKRIPTVLPPMTFEEALECTKIYSVAGRLEHDIQRVRPFRSPHHTATYVALCGGGQNLTPGELSLAHNGVLFLDELPEFQPNVLESMRAPLEDNEITIARAAGSVVYPCNVMLVCAMNPCKCGYLGHPTKPCTCSPGEIQRYRHRISGPLLDRIDLQVEVPAVSYEELSTKSPGESSAAIRARVIAAREIQRVRYRGKTTRKNADLSSPQIKEYCVLVPEAEALLKKTFDRMNLSARGYYKVIKVARTVADLAGSERIEPVHIAEALRFRGFDEKE